MDNDVSATPMSLLNNMLRQMNWGGYNPRNRTIFRIILGFLVWFLITITFILSGIYLFTNPYKETGLFMLDTVMLLGFWQLSMKLWTLFSKHRSILKLINLTDFKFWSLDILPQAERPEIQSVYKIAKFAAKSYAVCITFTMLGQYITTYLRGKENLLNNVWLPDTLKEWNSCLTTIDGIYITLIALVIAQLKIIKCKLLSLCENRSQQEHIQEISDCVEHHNMLFDYLRSIEDIFSTELLHVAASNIILAVLTMYRCMVTNEIKEIIAYGLVFVAVNMQLFIHCFMGQLIQDETLSVANAAYLSQWEVIPDKNVRLGLLLIILRSQKHFDISMGGLFILSLETFTRVSRMMLSLFTFMMNMDIAQ